MIDDMETSTELDHDELMEESSQDIDYDGHWGDTPHVPMRMKWQKK